VQLSSAIVFGLTFATVLTLVFTPCALMVRANLAGWRERRRNPDIRDGGGPRPRFLPRFLRHGA
jgi:multidrug efflux pump